MEIKNVQPRVLKVIAERIGEDESNIKPEQELLQDLNCDSLDCVEIMMGMENEFGIELDDDAFAGFITVQQVIDHIADVCTANDPPANQPLGKLIKLPGVADAFAMAGHIATIACFFDTARASLQERDKITAGEHTEHLHEIAQILAGDRNTEIYSPDETEFEQGVHYITNLIVNNSHLKLTHHRDQQGKVRLCIQMDAHPMRLTLYPQITEVRAFMAALKQLANDAEAHAAQAMHEVPELTVAHG